MSPPIPTPLEDKKSPAHVRGFFEFIRKKAGNAGLFFCSRERNGLPRRGQAPPRNDRGNRPGKKHGSFRGRQPVGIRFFPCLSLLHFEEKTMGRLTG